MSKLQSIDVTIYPDDCDAYGHLNQAAFLRVFERARWDAFGAAGGGLPSFKRAGAWPVVRKVTVDYRLPAFPGDVLEISTDPVKLGNTSLEVHQRAQRKADGALVAETQLVLVVVDQDGNPTQVPEHVAALFAGGGRRVTRAGEVMRCSVGDVTLSVDVRGDGPALLLVHGFPLDKSIWKHQVATLSGWRRIAPDLRGFGASDAPESGYSMAAYADDLAALLDRLKVDRAVVAGLSMGGYVIFEMLRRHRRRIAGLILCDTRAEADTAEGRTAREEMAELARTRGAAAVAERMVPKLLGRTTQQTQPPLVQQVTEMVTRSPVPGLAGASLAMKERPDSTELLATIDVPTLVVVGQEDVITPPAVARSLTNAIPSAALTTIAGAGHVTPLEAPTAVSRVFAEFLDAVREA